MTNMHNLPHPGETLREDGWVWRTAGGLNIWVSQQAAYDLWQLRQAGAPKVKRAILTPA